MDEQHATGFDIGLCEARDLSILGGGESHKPVFHVGYVEVNVGRIVVRIERGDILGGDEHGATFGDGHLEVAGQTRRRIAKLRAEFAAHFHRELPILHVAIHGAGAADGDEVLDHHVALQRTANIRSHRPDLAVEAAAFMDDQLVSDQFAFDVSVNLDLTAVADCSDNRGVFLDDGLARLRHGSVTLRFRLFQNGAPTADVVCRP